MLCGHAMLVLTYYFAKKGPTILKEKTDHTYKPNKKHIIVKSFPL